MAVFFSEQSASCHNKLNISRILQVSQEWSLHVTLNITATTGLIRVSSITNDSSTLVQVLHVADLAKVVRQRVDLSLIHI